MKKNIGLIILIIVMCIIAMFLAYIVVSKQHIHRDTFNLKTGDVLKFDEYNTNVTILNVANTLCTNKDKCIDKGEVEVSVKVEYNNETSNYVLKSTTKPKELIKNSNNYIKLIYENDKLEIIVKDKRES